MSSIRHVVAHVNDDTLSREVLRLGTSIAHGLGAEAAALLAIEQVAPGAYFNAETASLAQQLYREHVGSHRALAEELVRHAGERWGGAVTLQVSESDPVDALLAGSRTSDLLVVGQRTKDRTGGLSTREAARVLIGAGCPVLFTPHIGFRFADDRALPRRVLVAWAGTRESARATRDALPLLARADHVELVGFVHGGDDSASSVEAGLEATAMHLRRHAIDPVVSTRHSREPSLTERMRRGWTPDIPVAEALLSHAADVRAELIVMGGYGHARAWEYMLGGVTRTILHSMTVPVFMSH